MRGTVTWGGPRYFNAEAVVTKLKDAGALCMEVHQLSPAPTRAFVAYSLEGDCPSAVVLVGDPVKP